MVHTDESDYLLLVVESSWPDQWSTRGSHLRACTSVRQHRDETESGEHRYVRPLVESVDLTDSVVPFFEGLNGPSLLLEQTIYSPRGCVGKFRVDGAFSIGNLVQTAIKLVRKLSFRSA
jgi:hypothetical protein